MEIFPFRRLINETQRQIVALCLQRTTSVIRFSTIGLSALYTGRVQLLIRVGEFCFLTCF